MSAFKSFLNTASVSGFIAGFIVVLVGITSSVAIVFQAASAYGANSSEIGSWLGSLCVAMGILGIYLSVKYKSPILIAWSTPGAALLLTASSGINIAEAIGAFLISAILTMIVGFSGLFEKTINQIPTGITSALLAGVLFNFSVKAMSSFNSEPALLACMLLAYIVGKKYKPNFAMLFVLVVGVLVSIINNQHNFEKIEFVRAQFIFIKPEFNLIHTLSIAIPLFIVTMASQNMTGVLIMKSFEYNNPVSKIIGKIGAANFITAFFGGFTINLAAITAAIAMSPESDPDKNKRYFSAVVAGLFYLIIGLFAGTLTSVFSAFSKELVTIIAGLALLGTISGGLKKALADNTQNEAVFITFVIAVSDFKFLNIAAPFWALCIGFFIHVFFKNKLVTIK